MDNYDKLEEKVGFIVLLDVLGTKGMWLRTAPKTALQNFSNIVDSMEIWKDKLEKILASEKIKIDIATYFFSDTILITFMLDKDLNIVNALKKCSYFVSSIIVHGVENDILIRGSISFGKFYMLNEQKYSFVVGPAIDEAAEWYDKTEIIGVICSPSLNFMLDSHTNRDTNNRIEEYFIKYRVGLKNDLRLKNNDTYFTWILNWPILIAYYLGQDLDSSDSSENGYQKNLEANKVWVMEKFSKLNIGTYDFRKFENTIKFYEHVIEKLKSSQK